MRNIIVGSLLLCAVMWGAPTVSHVNHGTSLPATCSVGSGDIFFKTSATIGPYYCSATNTWTAIHSSGGGSSPGAPSQSIQVNNGSGGFIGSGATWDYTAIGTTFSGGDSWDCLFGGAFNDPTVPNIDFYAEFDSIGTPDTFTWYRANIEIDSGVPITGSAQSLSDGVTLTCATTTGHILGDSGQASTGVYTLPRTVDVRKLYQLQTGGVYPLLGVNGFLGQGPAAHGSSQTLQAFTGVSVDGNLVKFDINGNVTDSGVAVAGSEGKVACWKTTGQISYCESVVGVTGGCTCH